MEERFPVHHHKTTEGSQQTIAGNESGTLMVNLIGDVMRIVYKRQFPAYLVDKKSEREAEEDSAYWGELERFIHDNRTAEDLLRQVKPYLDDVGEEPEAQKPLIFNNIDDGQQWEDTGERLKLLPFESTTVVDLQRDQAASTYALLKEVMSVATRTTSSAHHEFRAEVSRQLG